ncbi:MAG: hypothetical protein ACP5NP_09585 [Acetobacteraceae bacterium]
MRRLAGLLGRREPEPAAIPPARLAHALAVLRRRVTDSVEDAFGRACLANDLATARDLVIVLDRMAQRGAHWPGGERRRVSGQVERLREELARCATLRVADGELV